MVLTAWEIIDIIIMTVALGYMFMDSFSQLRKKKTTEYDPLNQSYGFDWDAFIFACKVTAPAVILHEFGHKIAAMSYGMNATFHAAYGWLSFGILLKLMNFGMIFFIPAYVTHSAAATPLQSSVIAFAGPAVNLLLWLGAAYLIKNKTVHKKYLPFLVLTKQINMFLFFFNLIPIRPFDGSKVFGGLIATLF